MAQLSSPCLKIFSSFPKKQKCWDTDEGVIYLSNDTPTLNYKIIIFFI